MLTFPGFNKVAFEIGPIRVHWYGIMYLLGFAAAWWLARRRAAKPGSSWQKNDVDDLIFFAMLGVILGGRIGYVLFYGLTFWANDAWYPLRLWEGGMSFHGALIGVATALTLFAWRRGRHPADVYDFTVPLPALGLFFGRIGNFINSELWGKVTTVPWGFRVHGEVRHPSQLYEATLEGLVLFAALWWFTMPPRPAAGAFGPVPGYLRRGALPGGIRARARRADRLSRRRLVHRGAAAVAADDHRRRRAAGVGVSRAHTVGQLRRGAMKQYLELNARISAQVGGKD